MTTRQAPQLSIDRDVSMYTIAGRRVPSVTEILAIAGVVDFSGVPEEWLAKAAERGRLAHRITAEIDQAQGEPPFVPEELKGYVDAWWKFRVETGFTASLIEHALVNQEHRYAGTLDRYGMVGATPWLIDLKTSAAIPRWVGLQLAGYELALRPALSVTEAARVKRAAVRLRPDGTYSLFHFADRSDFADFLAASRIAHFQLQHGGYRIP